jgi:hypothetical protein
VTDIPGTVVGGVVVGGVTCASFISDDADAAGDASPACCDDGIGVCAAACCDDVAGVCAAACCARTGITVLIRARATADAIGVFLSFMTFPLVLALAMPKTAGGDVSSGRAGVPLLAAIGPPVPNPNQCDATILPLRATMLPIVKNIC